MIATDRPTHTVNLKDYVAHIEYPTLLFTRSAYEDCYQRYVDALAWARGDGAAMCAKAGVTKFSGGYASLLENLMQNVRFLAQWAEGQGGDWRCLVRPDFVPHSFSWIQAQLLGETDYYGHEYIRYGINGGLILHGFSETFSTTLDNHVGWQIHT